eukprot:358478-Chlamydomonas_euryale.AAC.9
MHFLRRNSRLSHAKGSSRVEPSRRPRRGATRLASVSRFSGGGPPFPALPTMTSVSPLGTSFTTPRIHCAMVAACAVGTSDAAGRRGPRRRRPELPGGELTATAAVAGVSGGK